MGKCVYVETRRAFGVEAEWWLVCVCVCAEHFSVVTSDVRVDVVVVVIVIVAIAIVAAVIVAAAVVAIK